MWPIERNLSGATTTGQSGSESNSNEGVLCITQSSSSTKASPSDYSVSYPGHSLRESYPSAEMQSVYSTASGACQPIESILNEEQILILLIKTPRYLFFFFFKSILYYHFIFHHTCESMCDTLPSSATNQKW